MSFVWKDAYTALLLERVAAGDIYAQIATRINATFGTSFSSDAVGKKLTRFRAPKRERAATGWPAPHRIKLTELYNQSVALSYSDLADQINKEFGTRYSRNAAIGQARRLGLTGKKPASSGGGGIAHRPQQNYKRARIVRPKPHHEPIGVVTESVAFKLRVVPVAPLHLELAELEPHQCRYPDGHGPFTFCGHPVRPGSSYCGSHHALCYKLPPPPKEYYFNNRNGAAA